MKIHKLAYTLLRLSLLATLLWMIVQPWSKPALADRDAVNRNSALQQEAGGYWQNVDAITRDTFHSDWGPGSSWSPRFGSWSNGGEINHKSGSDATQISTSCSWNFSNSDGEILNPGQILNIGMTVETTIIGLTSAANLAGSDNITVSGFGKTIGSAQNQYSVYGENSDTAQQANQGSLSIPSGSPGGRQTIRFACYVNAGMGIAYTEWVYEWIAEPPTAQADPVIPPAEPPAQPAQPEPIEPQPVQPAQPPAEPPTSEGNPPQGGVPLAVVVGGAAAVAAVAATAAAAAAAATTAAMTVGKPATARSASRPAPASSAPGLNGGPADNPNTIFDRGGNDPCQGLPYYMVNTATLGLVLEDVLFARDALEPYLKFKLTYNTSDHRRGLFGRGWRLSYESFIASNADRILVTRGSGQVLTYRRGKPHNPQQPYPIEAIPPQGIFDRLLDYGTYWVWMEKESHLLYYYERAAGQNQNRAFLSKIVDLSGNTLRMEYGKNHLLSAVVDASGRKYIFDHNDQGRCTRLVLPDGRQATFAYHANGFLVKAVDLAGISSTYSYDESGNLLRMSIDNGLFDTVFAYRKNASGNVTIASVTAPDGGVKRYEFIPGKAALVRITDPGGLVSEYENQGCLTTQVIDPSGAKLKVTYEHRLPTIQKDKRGGETRLGYDARGNLTSLRLPDGGEWAFTYNNSNLMVSETDPLGNTYQHEYNAVSKLTRSMYPSGVAEAYEYNARGQLTAMVDPAGERTSLEYDTHGNLSAWSDALGRTWQLVYNKWGLSLEAITDPGGRTTHIEYDGNERLTKVTFQDGLSRQYAYNCCAGVSYTDEKGEVHRFKHDALLRTVEYIDSPDQRFLLEYDPSGRLARWTRPSGAATTINYSTTTRILTLTDAAEGVVQIALDEHGNLLTLTNEKGAHSGYAYDLLDRLSSAIDSAGRQRRVQRDLAGQVTGIQNARGQSVTAAYTPDGWLAQVWCAGAETNRYAYDQRGFLLSMWDATGTTCITNDQVGQATQIDYPDGLRLSIDYDALGNATCLHYPGGLDVCYEYDTHDRPTQVKWNQHFIRGCYDGVGNLLEMERSNGIQTTCRYDAASRLIELRHGDQNALVDLKLEWDINGNLQQVVGQTPFDDAPLEKPAAFTYNADNQVETCDLERYQYDPDGNLIAIGDSSWIATYDAFNRPVELQRGTHKFKYHYDALGRRGCILSEQGSRNFHYDPWDRLSFVTDANGQVTESYIYLGKRLAAVAQSTGQVYFYHFDERGSTLALTGVDGSLAESYAYTPYGACAVRSAINTGNLFTFVGEYGVQDDGEGLYWMKRRWYDAHSGRFLQRDPLDLLGGANLYAYANQNPATWIDPEGTWVIGVGLLALTALTVGTLIYVGKGALATMRGEAAQKQHQLNAVTQLGDSKMDEKVMKIAVQSDTSGYGKGFSAVEEAADTARKIGIEAAVNALPGSKPLVEIGKNLASEGLDRATGGLGGTVQPGTASQSQPIPMRPGCRERNTKPKGKLR